MELMIIIFWEMIIIIVTAVETSNLTHMELLGLARHAATNVNIIWLINSFIEEYYKLQELGQISCFLSFHTNNKTCIS
jgi:hypothetical protein